MSTDYALDEQVGYLMRLAMQRHTAIFQKHTIDGLTPTQFSTLVRLNEQGRASQNELGRLAGMDIATIKGVVDRLRERGLVSSEPSPEDKRRSLISLTEAGRTLLTRMLDRGRVITEETLEPLSPSDRATLVALLKHLS